MRPHSRSTLGYLLLVALLLSECIAPLPVQQPQPTPVQATPMPVPVLADLSDLFPSSVTSYTTPYPFTIRTEVIATLNVPTGEIIASDLFFGTLTQPLVRRVPPGQYPVSLSLMRENTQAWESVAAAKIQFLSAQPVSWELALIPGQDLSSLKPGEIFGYAGDSGTGSFASPASAQALTSKLDQDQDYTDEINKASEVHSTTGSWASLIPDPTTGHNIVFFASGYGDVFHASYWGLDQRGQAVCLITDFTLVEIKKLPIP